MSQQQESSVENLSDEVIKQKLDSLFQSPESLIQAAKNYSCRPHLTETEQESVYYYYLLKCFIAEHQCYIASVSVQTYNEHRMALDHFFRAKIEQNESHNNKARGHLNRALLDIIKINCYFLSSRVKAIHKTIPNKAVGIVSNGKYIQDYFEKQKNAEDLLMFARIEDNKMGNCVYADKVILEHFIVAYFAHKKWFEFQSQNLGKIAWAKTKYYMLSGLSITGAFLLGLAVNYLSNILFN